MAKLLLVDGDRAYTRSLRNNLEVEGYVVEVAHDARWGLRRALTAAPAVIVLDCVLPGGDGVDLLRRVRERGCDAPVLVLTAVRDDAAKLRAFAAGADDYVGKPCGILELVARIRRLLRRVRLEDETESSWIRLGAVEIHPASRTVRRDGVPVSLTAKEYDLLIALLRSRGRIVSRPELYHEVWKDDSGTCSRTVDTHILMLRKKLERRLIRTVRAAGYTIAR